LDSASKISTRALSPTGSPPAIILPSDLRFIRASIEGRTHWRIIPTSTPPPETNGSLDLPESENRKHELIGNVVYDARYRERRSGKKIADFHLATHEEKNKTEYYRVRAFDDLAEKVRDNIRKGQKGVEVVA